MAQMDEVNSVLTSPVNQACWCSPAFAALTDLFLLPGFRSNNMARTFALRWASSILLWLVVLRLSSSILIVPPHSSNAGITPRGMPGAVTSPANRLHRMLKNCNHRRTTTSSVRLSSKRNDDNKEELFEEESNFNLNEFLDRQFFEPDKVLEDKSSNPLLKRLASFVIDDYAKAEAILSALFFVVLIIVAQEALRMQLYGGNYEPFSRGVLPGNLF